MLRSYIENGHKCVQYVDTSGRIASLQFRSAVRAPVETYVFVARGVVWMYELDPDTDLATRVRPAVNGQSVAGIELVPTCIVENSVFAIQRQNLEFVRILELMPNQQPLTYSHQLDAIPDAQYWLWYNGRLQPVVDKRFRYGKLDGIISMPHTIYYQGVNHNVEIFDINCDGLCLICMGKSILAGWCVKRDALIWIHDCEDAGIVRILNAKYASENVIEYILLCGTYTRLWQYYNATDGTSYEVC
jgi:hypothetical protein